MLYYGLHWNLHMRVAPSIILSDEQKNELTRLSRSGRTSVRLAERSRIVLLAAEGLQNKEIAHKTSIAAGTVRNHLANIFKKLHVRCRSEATAKYLRTMQRGA